MIKILEQYEKFNTGIFFKKKQRTIVGFSSILPKLKKKEEVQIKYYCHHYNWV